MYSADDAPIDELISKRLRLRPPRRGDVEPLHAAIDETIDDLARWLPWAKPGHGRIDTRRYLRGARSALARRSAFEYVIEEIDGGGLAGITSLHRVDWGRRSAGLGYWIRRSRWRRGYAVEAARAAVHYGFRRLGLHRIEIHVALENHPSHGVVAKLGAVREGIARDAEFIGGAYLDHVQYSLLSSEWGHGA